MPTKKKIASPKSSSTKKSPAKTSAPSPVASSPRRRQASAAALSGAEVNEEAAAIVYSKCLEFARVAKDARQDRTSDEMIQRMGVLRGWFEERGALASKARATVAASCLDNGIHLLRKDFNFSVDECIDKVKEMYNKSGF